jgi:nicotinate phosphoribosyltransferase
MLFPIAELILATFGIGTFLTNDFYTQSSGGKEKSKALNMVIKIASVNATPCVKISDDLMKVWLSAHYVDSFADTFLFQNTGDPATVRKVKELFDLPI